MQVVCGAQERQSLVVETPGKLRPAGPLGPSSVIHFQMLFKSVLWPECSSLPSPFSEIPLLTMFISE